MGCVSVSSCRCRCCMFVLCVHPVAVLNAIYILRQRTTMRFYECLNDLVLPKYTIGQSFYCNKARITFMYGWVENQNTKDSNIHDGISSVPLFCQCLC